MWMYWGRFISTQAQTSSKAQVVLVQTSSQCTTWFFRWEFKGWKLKYNQFQYVKYLRYLLSCYFLSFLTVSYFFFLFPPTSFYFGKAQYHKRVPTEYIEQVTQLTTGRSSTDVYNKLITISNDLNLGLYSMTSSTKKLNVYLLGSNRYLQRRRQYSEYQDVIEKSQD